MEEKQMEVILTKSNKGGEKIFIGEFGYHFRSQSSKGVYRWVCTHRKALLCRSSVLTRKFGEYHSISRAPMDHNHPGVGCAKVVGPGSYTKSISNKEQCIATRSGHLGGDSLAEERVPIEGEPVQRVQRNRPKKRKQSVVLNTNCSSHDEIVKQEHIETCWDGTGITESVPDQESNQNTINTTAEAEEERFHINDEDDVSKRKPFVCSDQEADGTVNIRIFLEESLLSSFVINAQHTSNVNIRISKDEIRRNTTF